MKKYTTQTYRFDCSIDISNATAMFITFCQNGIVVLEKSKDDITMITDSNSSFLLKLEQEDSELMHEGELNIQITVLFPDGNRETCSHMYDEVEEVNKREVITNE